MQYVEDQEMQIIKDDECNKQINQILRMNEEILRQNALLMDYMSKPFMIIKSNQKKA